MVNQNQYRMINDLKNLERKNKMILAMIVQLTFMALAASAIIIGMLENL